MMHLGCRPGDSGFGVPKDACKERTIHGLEELLKSTKCQRPWRPFLSWRRTWRKGGDARTEMDMDNSAGTSVQAFSSKRWRDGRGGEAGASKPQKALVLQSLAKKLSWPSPLPGELGKDLAARRGGWIPQGRRVYQRSLVQHPSWKEKKPWRLQGPEGSS